MDNELSPVSLTSSSRSVVRGLDSRTGKARLVPVIYMYYVAYVILGKDPAIFQKKLFKRGFIPHLKTCMFLCIAMNCTVISRTRRRGKKV